MMLTRKFGYFKFWARPPKSRIPEVSMTPYVQSLIPKEEREIFEEVRRAVIDMPDIDLGVDEDGEPILLSCHMLARAVGKFFSLQCVDGYFIRFYEHSWLLTPNNNIIDVYPVGILGGPTMTNGGNGIIGQQLYFPQNTRKMSHRRFGKNSFKRSVRRIISALR